MARFKPYDYRQTELIPVAFDRQILAGTFEYTLCYLIDHELDLSLFHSHFQNDETGRLAYDPALLLKIVLLAYSRGVTSSRKMAQLCRENVLFMALSAHSQPHFTTLADFIARSSEQIQQLFVQILLVCEDQGLIGKELFAVDGCKLPSNASKEWSGTHDTLRQKHQKMDEAVAFLLSKQREQDRLALDDDLQAREAQQIKTLQRASAKIKAFLASSKPRIGKQGTEVQSNVTDPESAKMKSSHGVIQGYNGLAAVDQQHQIIVHAQAYGQGQDAGLLPPAIEAIAQNLNLKPSEVEHAQYLADAGFQTAETLQYLEANSLDAYVADQGMRARDPRFKDYKLKHKPKREGPSGKLTPADFTIDLEAKTCVCPAGQSLKLKHPLRVFRGQRLIVFRGRDAECQACPLRARCVHRQHQKTGRSVVVNLDMLSGIGHPLLEKMKAKLDTLEGRALYSQRLGIVEPVFGHLTSAIGLRRFSYRGLRKVNAQWQLFACVHNLLKLHRYGSIG